MNEDTAITKTHKKTLDEFRDEVGPKVALALNTPRQIVRVSKSGRSKTVELPAVGDRQTISARELWLYCVGEGKPIDWIESYKALLKYVSKTYVHIFNPVVEGTNSGKRYQVKVDNVIEFLARFEANELN
jgi:intein/homing endonuclease